VPVGDATAATWDDALQLCARYLRESGYRVVYVCAAPIHGHGRRGPSLGIRSNGPSVFQYRDRTEINGGRGCAPSHSGSSDLKQRDKSFKRLSQEGRDGGDATCFRDTLLAGGRAAPVAAQDVRIPYSLAFSGTPARGTTIGTWGGGFVQGAYGNAEWMSVSGGAPVVGGTYRCDGGCTFDGTVDYGSAQEFFVGRPDIRRHGKGYYIMEASRST
jgi:hypothetical protein